MDSSRFDSLAKRLAASPHSRRTALRAASAALAALVGTTASAGATTCRPYGTLCRKDVDCCSGTCSPPDQSGRRRCEHSCFVAGTLVAMADGTSRPIELIGFGDLVLGDNNSVSRVIAIETPRLGSRSLFGLNGGAPFVTAEHPFMTADGWKSIDPAATEAEQPELPVGRLRVGDTLVQLAEIAVPAMIGGNEPVAASTRPVALRSLEAASGHPGTILYNLLLDGDHTYFANGLLVHNKA